MKKLIILSSIILLNVSCFAQTKDTVNLNEIQISGRHSDKDPISVTHLNTDSTKTLFTGQDPFYIMNRYVPGIYSQSDNGVGLGYCYMHLRGFDQTRIAYSLNDIPIQENEDQGIYFSNMPGFYNNISSIDVERGVGINKSGTTAMAGSVNMQTRSMLDTQMNFSYGYGSYNTNAASLGYTSGKLSNNMAFGLQGSYLTTDGFKHNSGAKGGNIFGQVGYFGKSNIFKVYGFYGSSSNQMAYGTPTDSMIKADYRVNTNIPSEQDKFQQSFIAANWVNFKSSKLTFNTSLYSNSVIGSYSVMIDTLYQFGIGSHQIGAMSNAVYHENNLTLNIGVNYNYYQRMHNNYLTSNVDNVFYVNHGYKQDFIGYLKADYRIGNFNLFGECQSRTVNFSYKENMNVGGSALADFNTTWSFLNPKVGIKYSKNSHDVYFSIAHSKREPTRSDLFNGYDGITPIGGGIYTALGDTFSINLKPESIYDFELGSSYRKNGLMLSGNLYAMYITNELVAIGRLNYIVFHVKKNLSHSIRTGIEANVSYSTGHFFFATNGCWSYNKIDTGNSGYVTPFATPGLIFNNFAVYKRKFYSVGLNGMYVSKSYLDNTQNENYTSPQYYIINFVGALTYNKMSLTFNVNNILNQKYYIPAGIVNGHSSYYVGALFNYFATLRVII